jgi:hypothetical protein
MTLVAALRVSLLGLVPFVNDILPTGVVVSVPPRLIVVAAAIVSVLFSSVPCVMTAPAAPAFRPVALVPSAVMVAPVAALVMVSVPAVSVAPTASHAPEMTVLPAFIRSGV